MQLLMQLRSGLAYGLPRAATIALALTITACGGVDNRKKDTTPPTLNMPDDLFVYATSPDGATVSWAATATDDFVSGSIPVTCTPSWGSLFPIGATTVTCTASDASRNIATRSFTVTVSDTDTTPPVLSLPANIALSTGNAAGTQVSWTTPLASDDRDGGVPVSCTPAAGLFAVGVTTVTCTATDAGGNTATGTFTVTVTLTTTTILQMDAGSGFTCAVLSDHTARCWGSASSGKLGNGNAYDANGVAINAWTPTVVVDGTGAPLANVLAVTAGQNHACALVDDGTARCWGRYEEQLGIGTVGDPASLDWYIDTPTTPVVTAEGTPLTGIVALDAGYAHTCAVLTDGSARCWGRNGPLGGIVGYGQLGDGTDQDSATPVPVIDPNTGSELEGVTSISTGYQHTCAVLADGTARCWGLNNHGQLGNGTQSEYDWTSVIDPVTHAPLAGVTAIQASVRTTCAVINDGTARCWGRGNLIGSDDPDHGQSSFPIAVIDPVTGAALGGVMSLAIGTSSDGFVARSCARINDGTLRCWGNDPGDGSFGSATAVLVSGLAGAIAVTAGTGHSCAIVDHGSGARCWGNNSNGSLGNGTNVDSLVPVAVSGLP